MKNILKYAGAALLALTFLLASLTGCALDPRSHRI